MSLVIQYPDFHSSPGEGTTATRLWRWIKDREFTLTISNRAFEERHFPYQDGAALCYQKLQKGLLTETPTDPLQHHLTVSDQDLDEYLAKHRPARKRSW